MVRDSIRAIPKDHGNSKPTCNFGISGNTPSQAPRVACPIPIPHPKAANPTPNPADNIIAE
jgi:hypothetical protein